MLGPFATSEVAEQKARVSRVVHYRVEPVITSSARRKAAIRNEEAQQMPYRHWFVVLTVNGVESRHGPYASRTTAERKSEQYKNAANAAVKLVYETAPLRHNGRN